jgi:hypothetical protein
MIIERKSHVVHTETKGIVGEVPQVVGEVPQEGGATLQAMLRQAKAS